MNIFWCAAGFSIHRSGKQNLVYPLLWALCFAISPQGLLASQDQNVPPQQQDAQQSPGELQQLVAPIALYPDSLASQILAASTYPEQVVEADRWVQVHPALQGEAFGQAVDQQPWDPSIKALTAFPSILGNMDKNLSWTSSLGDAYYNQQSDVMAAVQVMRQRAQAAGNLQSDPRETVTTQDFNISIEPADSDDVYVPAYDPWVVFGDRVAPWPGWFPYPGIWFDGPSLYFGAHFGIGWYRSYGWGWNHWGVDWRGRSVLYDRNRFHSSSTTFYSRNAFDRGGVERFERREGESHPVERPRPFNGDTRAARGYAEPRGESGIRSNAFSGYDHGGEERGFSSRGSESFGGGGGFHGGGGRR